MHIERNTIPAALGRADSISSEVVFQTLFESSPDEIVLTDHEDRITRVNMQAEQVFGDGRAELLGAPVEMPFQSGFAQSIPLVGNSTLLNRVCGRGGLASSFIVAVKMEANFQSTSYSVLSRPAKVLYSL